MLIEGIDYRRIAGEDYNPYGRQYETLRDYTFFFRTTPITIPAGYQWDGPTAVPYVGTINKGWLEPSLHHDYLYEENGNVAGVSYSRREVDEHFFQNLRSNGVSGLYIWIMRHWLDSVFQGVWDDTSEGSTKVMKRYMVPVILVAFAVGAAITSGVIFTIPTLIKIALLLG